MVHNSVVITVAPCIKEKEAPPKWYTIQLMFYVLQLNGTQFSCNNCCTMHKINEAQTKWYTIQLMFYVLQLNGTQFSCNNCCTMHKMNESQTNLPPLISIKPCPGHKLC
jgi:recombinational DNA repair protein (RecF pathway)